MITNYGIILIQKTGDYKKALLDWFNCLAHEKTWVKFKQQFTTAQTEPKHVTVHCAHKNNLMYVETCH